MKYVLLSFLILSAASCFKNKAKDSSQSELQDKQIITTSDFMERLTIKFEVYKADTPDSQSWTVDSLDNFEGVWVSQSEELGLYGLKYTFSLSADGHIDLELEQFKAKLSETTKGQYELSKFLGSIKQTFRKLESLSLNLSMFDRNSEKQLMVSVTPILKAD